MITLLYIIWSIQPTILVIHTSFLTKKLIIFKQKTTESNKLEQHTVTITLFLFLTYQPMIELYTSYLIKTSDQQQAIIDNSFFQSVEIDEIESQLSDIIGFDEPSEEALGKLFAAIAMLDAE